MIWPAVVAVAPSTVIMFLVVFKLLFEAKLTAEVPLRVRLVRVSVWEVKLAGDCSCRKVVNPRSRVTAPMVSVKAPAVLGLIVRSEPP